MRGPASVSESYAEALEMRDLGDPVGPGPVDKSKGLGGCAGPWPVNKSDWCEGWAGMVRCWRAGRHYAGLWSQSWQRENTDADV